MPSPSATKKIKVFLLLAMTAAAAVLFGLGIDDPEMKHPWENVLFVVLGVSRLGLLLLILLEGPPRS